MKRTLRILYVIEMKVGRSAWEATIPAYLNRAKTSRERRKLQQSIHGPQNVEFRIRVYRPQPEER